MGDVGAARYEPALHPSSPTIYGVKATVPVRDLHIPADEPGSLSVKVSVTQLQESFSISAVILLILFMKNALNYSANCKAEVKEGSSLACF